MVDSIPPTAALVTCRPFIAQGPKEVNCWGEVPGDDFRVRSRTYLKDRIKQPAGDTMFTLAAVVRSQTLDMCSPSPRWWGEAP